MPIGRATLSKGTDIPVAALKVSMKKSAYLKYTRKATGIKRDRHKISLPFLVFLCFSSISPEA